MFDDTITQIDHFCNQNLLNFHSIRYEIIKFSTQKLILEIRYQHWKYFTNFQTIAA